MGKILHHVTAHHQQADTLARREPGDSQRPLYIDCAGLVHCQAPSKLRREVEDHSGRRYALPVCFAESKPIPADISLNCMDIRRVTSQLPYLLFEAFDIFRVAHEHPGLVPCRSKTGQ
ncbi:hypothetical protein D3C75_916710 [compost metagenome]